MCRLAGFIGHEPITLAALLYDPPHSLEKAAYMPRELVSGTVNVDGTGVAWWPDEATEPLRYVTTQPPWSDANLPGLAPALSGRTVLAAVRSATPGLPFGPDNVAPFVVDGLAAVHNGSIGGFCGAVGRELLAGLSDERFGQMTAMNDSQALALLVAQHVEDEPGADLAQAVTAAIHTTAKIVTAAGEQASLNLAVAAREEIVVVRTSAGTALNSLYTRHTPQGSWVASEPLDGSSEWTPAPEHSLTILTADQTAVRQIAHDGMSP